MTEGKELRVQSFSVNTDGHAKDDDYVGDLTDQVNTWIDRLNKNVQNVVDIQFHTVESKFICTIVYSVRGGIK